MNSKIFIGFLAMLLVSVFIAAEVLAECPEGKNPVQLTTPSGKTKTLCIPDAAVQGIENAAEHSGGTIVAATCDCWSQSQINDIDSNAKLSLECYSRDIYCQVGSTCPGYVCDVVYSDTGEMYAKGYIIFPRDIKTGNYECKNYWIEYFETGMDKQEYDACVSLLATYRKMILM
jgi:hypothetical protein